VNFPEHEILQMFVIATAIPKFWSRIFAAYASPNGEKAYESWLAVEKFMETRWLFTPHAQ